MALRESEARVAETQCLKIKLKPGKTEAFLNWASSLPERRDEVRKALESGGVITEQIFLERGPQGDYLIFYMKAESLARANIAFTESTLPLDIETKKVIAETWETEGIRGLEVIVDW
jgi:hypothetical protein